MVVELIFDKVFVSIVIFLRPETIADPNLDTVSLLTRHLGILFPAFLTALDIKDALDLSDHVEDAILREKKRRFAVAGLTEVDKYPSALHQHNACVGGATVN